MRKCLTCGQGYKYCPTCGEDERKPLWMELYCSENCKDIFDIATEYSFGHITVDEAQDKFSKCDLSKLDSLKESVKNDVKKILNSKKTSVDFENKEVKTSKFIK